MEARSDVVIIGGGIIGVCSAYFLAKQGRQVTLIEQGEIGQGCSYGNAGLIVPSHSIPLAAPGVLTQGLKWMLDAESPFYVKPRLKSDLMSWLWRFRSFCKEEPMRTSIPVLRDLQRASLALFRALVKEEHLSCDFAQNGTLTLFKTDRGYREGIEKARLLEEFDISLEILDADTVRIREPGARPDLSGGIYFRDDAQVDPIIFVRQLANCVEGLGGNIEAGIEVLGFEVAGRRISAIRTTRGSFRASQVVLATGAWSPAVARNLGLKLPIQPAKGYSITVKRPEICPRVPLMLAEAKVAVTPFASMLRFAGTLELAGFDMTINQRRVNAIRQAADDYLVGVGQTEVIEIWQGLRPCTPDGLPFIGRAPSLENLIVATGHAMLGVSLGPVTGELVAQIACEAKPAIDPSAFRVERFNNA